MLTRVAVIWDRLRSSFWFVPLLMTVGAGGLAFATVALDRAVTASSSPGWGWAYEGGAEGAAAVLGAVAGSMITIAGLVFSMTLVALSMTSSQFGPRLLRNFMRDTINQVVLGTFVATFLYCLLVLRTIRRADEAPFVPHLSVTLGVLMAVASLGVLIYFIHHVAVSIQADEIVARVADELMGGIERLYPSQIGLQPTATTPTPALIITEGFDQNAQVVTAAGDGYIQRLDADTLMTLATAANVEVKVERRPGQYATFGTPLALVSPAGQVNEELQAKIRATFHLGSQRTDTQDIEFAVHQLVEVAVRALSPGINDPFTAVTCVDRLGSALCRLARCEAPSPHRFDDSGKLRVIAVPVSFGSVVDAAFNQIRQYARKDAAVTIRLLETISLAASAVTKPDDVAALQRHADMVARSGRDGLPEENDRQEVEERYQAACQQLQRVAIPSLSRSPAR